MDGLQPGRGGGEGAAELCPAGAAAHRHRGLPGWHLQEEGGGAGGPGCYIRLGAA